jgi:ankyrin repeat protein
MGVPERASARIVNFLLDNGLDVNSARVMDDYPCNTVWFAVARGRNRTLVKLLVDRGAKPNGLFAAGWYDDVDMIELLLRSGASIDEHAEDETPFLHCWKNQRFKSAKFLVRRGANVNFQDSKGKTALHYAIEKSFDPELIRFLVANGASPDINDRTGVSPRLKAARKRDKRFVEVLA